MENSDSKPRGKREGERAKGFGKKKERVIELSQYNS